LDKEIVWCWGFVKDYDVIVFRNGYAKDCPEMKVEFKGIRVEKDKKEGLEEFEDVKNERNKEAELEEFEGVKIGKVKNERNNNAGLEKFERNDVYVIELGDVLGSEVVG